MDSEVQQTQTRSRFEEAMAGVDESGQSLDKVRDILFGANMRTYEQRLAVLEQRMLEEIAQMRAAADAKFEHFESSLREELKALGDQLKSEKGERSAEVTVLQENLKSAADTWERRVVQLDGRLTESDDGLGNQIRDQTKALTAQLHQTSSEITARIDRQLDELRAAKPDTASLAAMFAELAERLRDQSPDAD